MSVPRSIHWRSLLAQFRRIEIGIGAAFLLGGVFFMVVFFLASDFSARHFSDDDPVVDGNVTRIVGP